MSEIDARVERSLLRIREAAIAELAASGWGGFTIESVAARAGLARSTVYRHWTSKLDLAVDALEHHSTQPPMAQIEPGRPRVVALVRHLAEAMADRQRSAIVPALVDAAEREPALRKVLLRFSEGRRKALTAALADMGVAEPDLVAIALAGAVMYRRVMSTRPFSPDDAEALVAAVLGG